MKAAPTAADKLAVAQANADWSIPALWVFLGGYVAARRADLVLLPAPQRARDAGPVARRGGGVSGVREPRRARHRRRHRGPGGLRGAARPRRGRRAHARLRRGRAALRPRAARRAPDRRAGRRRPPPAARRLVRRRARARARGAARDRARPRVGRRRARGRHGAALRPRGALHRLGPARPAGRGQRTSARGLPRPGRLRADRARERARRRDRRRAARAGGGVRAREARAPGHRRAPRRPADGAPARRGRRRAAAARDRGARRRGAPRARHAGRPRRRRRRRPRPARSPTGASSTCDLVVIAVGIRPHIELARAAGLRVERGVVVDDRMVTSHPRVLAVGECAQHRGVVHGIVAPIHDQAAVAADDAHGTRERATPARSPRPSSRSWGSTS